VPAAGIGKRMQSTLPKQYLKLNGAPVLQHCLQHLLDIPRVSGLVVAIRDDDQYWNDIKLSSDKPVIVTQGGAERCDSVLNALQCLSQQSEFNTEQDWVMVHDAVRPCVRHTDIERLINAVGTNPAGGLLAIPVRDTMKRQQNGATVAQTVDREGLWHAQTPQLFLWQALHQALLNARQKGHLITDESSAMEMAGYAPQLIEGSTDNIKITRAEDLRLAELYLDAQQKAL
jgi:2-C-methyl-D-erythritol 4-phosphate cytidylyltransferase